MKKNHINFAHSNKWSDSLTSPVESPSVVTENRDGTANQKLKFAKNRVWTRHHSYYRKLQSLKYLFSPKIIINEFTKETKIFFQFFGPDED